MAQANPESDHEEAKKSASQLERRFKDGAENRIRTDDLRITNALLYQLSYLGAFPVTMGILTDPGVAGNFRIYQLCNESLQSW